MPRSCPAAVCSDDTSRTVLSPPQRWQTVCLLRLRFPPRLADIFDFTFAFASTPSGQGWIAIASLPIVTVGVVVDCVSESGRPSRQGCRRATRRLCSRSPKGGGSSIKSGELSLVSGLKAMILAQLMATLSSAVVQCEMVTLSRPTPVASVPKEAERAGDGSHRTWCRSRGLAVEG